MSLKELTASKHAQVERQDFVYILLSGRIRPEEYFKFICNQYICYFELENKLYDWFESNGLQNLRRSSKLREDIAHFEKVYGFLYRQDMLCPSSLDYIKYVKAADQATLVPHVYVRHFGDMFGGQMIARKVPGIHKLYEFENKAELIAKVRALLDDSMAEEANRCFDFAIALFKDLNPNQL